MTGSSLLDARSRRRRGGLSVRVLIGLVLGLGGGSGWYLYRGRAQQRAVEHLARAGSYVDYDRGWAHGDASIWLARPPSSLVDRIGIDYFANVTEVTVRLAMPGSPHRPPFKADAVMVPIGQLGYLRRLDLSGCAVTKGGLSQLRRLRCLRELDLTGARIDGELIGLKGLRGPLALQLGGSNITDSGLVQLKELDHLQELDVGGTAITDAGLTSIAELTVLRALGLQQTRITDAGLVHLRGMKYLRVLSLSGPKITDAGVSHLKELKSLSRLHLRQTAVTSAGIKELYMALPRLATLAWD